MRSLIIIAALLPTTLGTGEFTSCPMPNPPSKATITAWHEHKCLATAIYGEARGEAERGMTAVAYTVLNRLKHSSKKTVCRIVLAPMQYSIFNNNQSLRNAAMSLELQPMQKNIVESRAWARAMKIADAVLKNRVPDPTLGSTHYLAPVVMKLKKYKYPKWSKEYQLMTVIDNHRFYKPVDKIHAKS